MCFCRKCVVLVLVLFLILKIFHKNIQCTLQDFRGYYLRAARVRVNFQDQNVSQKS